MCCPCTCTCACDVAHATWLRVCRGACGAARAASRTGGAGGAGGAYLDSVGARGEGFVNARVELAEGRQPLPQIREGRHGGRRVR
eukprot:7265808-Prymnesium_polylepis.1